MGQVKGRPLNPVPALEPHQEGDGGVQQVQQRARQDGEVDVLPLEGKQQAGDALRHGHQTLQVWWEEQRGCILRGSRTEDGKEGEQQSWEINNRIMPSPSQLPPSVSETP